MISFKAAKGVARTVTAFRMAAVVLAMVTVSSYAYAGATDARSGTVVTVQSGPQVDSQVSYHERSERYDESPSRTRSVVGGVIGGIAGAVLARNSSSYNRYAAGAGGAAVGTAVGYAMDRRADARQANDYTEERRDRGAQVIVRLDGGQTVAVYSNRTSGLYPGAKVWLIGNDTLIPAN